MVTTQDGRKLLKFGQTVKIEVLDKSRKKVIFSSEGLRVDFNIKILIGFNRAKFSIYNLNRTTVSNITGNERYVRIYVQLHDGNMQRLSYDFYLNNAMHIERLPESVTELYCISVVNKDFTDKQVNLQINKPSLPNYLEALRKAAGVNIKFKYTHFPDIIKNYTPLRSVSTWSGSVSGAINKLANAYGFDWYVEGTNTVRLKFRPLESNQKYSGQNESHVYKLKSTNMRSTPRVGVAELQVDSNLDFSITPSTVLDTTELITKETTLGFEDLTIVNGFLGAVTEGNARFSVLTIEHIGSNYTKQWNTKVLGIKAAKGTKASTFGYCENK